MSTDATNREAAIALAEALGNLPLALEQAAAYTARTALSLAEYLELFRERAAAHVTHASPSADYPTALAVTFEIAFARISEESPDAANLLTLCAFLAPDDVPLEIFSDGIAAGMLSDAPAAAATIQAYALAKVRGESYLSIHRLTQAIARDRLGDDERKEWAEAAVTVMQAAFPFEQRDTRTWPPSERLLQHALTATEHASALNVAGEQDMLLLNNVGVYLSTKDELTGAKAAMEKSIELCERLLGTDNSELSVRLNNLGEILSRQGNLDEAAEYLKRALTIDEAALGSDHPKIAIRLNNIGTVLHDRGAFAEAREHFERALAIVEAAHGAQGMDEDVALLLNNIGAIFYEQGDLKGARDYLERALPIDEEVFGPDHPDVALRLKNLGRVLADSGDVDAARRHFERALQIFLKHLGEKHPLTLDAKQNLEELDKRAASDS